MLRDATLLRSGGKIYAPNGKNLPLRGRTRVTLLQQRIDW